MLQVKELRIGNYIQFTDGSKIVEIEEIFKVHPHPEYFVEWIVYIHGEEPDKHGNSLLSEFSPVALSPDLLEQIGFEPVNALDDYIIYSIPKSNAASINGNYFKEKASFKINGIEKELCFLHQLQNLLLDFFDKEVGLS